MRLSAARAFRAGASALAAAALLAGCTSIEVSARQVGELEEGRPATFAFADGGLVDADLAAIRDEVRAAIGRELGARGMREVARDEAGLLVEFGVDVSERTVANNAYYDFYATEVVEEGTLSIALRDARTDALVWEGSGTSELRVSAVILGPLAAEPRPTRYARDWRVDEKVAAILRELPRGG